MNDFIPLCRRVLSARWLAVLFCSAAWTATCCPARADTADERFLAGLRQRQLYRLAETFCQQRLAEQGLPIEEHAALVVEFSRTLAEHAWQESPPKADPLWRRAMEVPADFARDHPDAPGALLARVQAALVLLARGELIRQQAEVRGQDQRTLAEARGYLSTARRELLACATLAADRLRELGDSGRDKPGFLSRAELVALANNLRYQLARVSRNQAECYAPDTPDRHNALSLATEHLQPLTELDAEDPLYWPSRLEVVHCLRLARDYDEADERLASLLSADPPADIRQRALAEQILLPLDQDRLAEALKLADQLSAADMSAAPEVAFASLRVQLKAWRAAAEQQDVAASKRYEQQASALVDDIQRLHGPYWTRRAESLLAGSVAKTGGGSDLAVLIRAAEAEYRAGQIDNSLDAYDRARQQAAQDGQQEEAFKLGYTAASIEHQRKQHAAAAERFRALSLASPDESQAPAAHLLAIYNAGQAAKTNAKAANGKDPLAEYVAMLDEHLRQWPKGSTTGQIEMLRAKLAESRGDWPAAVAAYRGVPTDQEQFAEAVDGAVYGYGKWLAQLQNDQEAAVNVANDGARWFESLFLGTDNRWPARWGQIDRTAALAAARLWLAAGERAVPRAERIVTEALAGTRADETDEAVVWRADASCLLIAALARQGRLDEARDEVDKLETVRPQAMQQLLEELSGLNGKLPKQQQAPLAELQGRVARLAGGRNGQLGKSAQRAIDLAQARAHAAAGRTTEAIAAYAALAEKYPREGQIQEEYALALSAAKDRKTLELALAKWHEVETKSRAGGDRWLRARYQLAAVLYRLGDHKRSATVINSTRVLHPELGGKELQQRFLKLLEKVQPPESGAK
ncbi:MAG: tetratricopeptide repeat protein [Pirellulales bacterium]